MFLRDGGRSRPPHKVCSRIGWWMVGVMFRGGADMAVRRVDCCDCILRDRCHWLGGGGSCVGACDLGWASVMG